MNKLQQNLDQNIKLFIQQNAFENAVDSIFKCILLNEKFYILMGNGRFVLASM